MMSSRRSAAAVAWMAGELIDDMEVHPGRHGTTVRIEMVLQDS